MESTLEKCAQVSVVTNSHEFIFFISKTKQTHVQRSINHRVTITAVAIT